MVSQSQQVNIKGDGNAVGNHNRVTVIKKTTTVYKNNGAKGSDGHQEEFFLLGICVFIALIVASYYFALHAPTVYKFLRTIAGVEFLLAIVGFWYAYKEGSTEVFFKCLATLALTLIASLSLMDAHRSYPLQLTDIAQQVDGVKAYWCRLNDLGRQLVMQHMLSSSIGFVVGLLLLLPMTLTFVYFNFSECNIRESTYELLKRFTSFWFVVFAFILIATASYFHTNSGWTVWQGWFKQPPSFFCAKV
jgi:hypothetical protein